MRYFVFKTKKYEKSIKKLVEARKVRFLNKRLISAMMGGIDEERA